MAALLKKLEPDYTVTAFALPFGAMPAPAVAGHPGELPGGPLPLHLGRPGGAEPCAVALRQALRPGSTSRASGPRAPRPTSSRSATGSTG